MFWCLLFAHHILVVFSCPFQPFRLQKLSQRTVIIIPSDDGRFGAITQDLYEAALEILKFWTFGTASSTSRPSGNFSWLSYDLHFNIICFLQVPLHLLIVSYRQHIYPCQAYVLFRSSVSLQPTCSVFAPRTFPDFTTWLTRKQLTMLFCHATQADAVPHMGDGTSIVVRRSPTIAWLFVPEDLHLLRLIAISR